MNSDHYMEEIPLYVNGSLDSVIVNKLEEIIPTNPDLSRELRECEEIAAACVTISRKICSPSPDLFTRISARIKEDNVHVGSQALRVSKQVLLVVKNIFSWSGFGWTLAAIQMALIVLIISGPVNKRQYHTLSETGQGDINLIFTPDTSETDIRALLTEIGASIVKGPSSEGLYVIRLKTKNPNAVVSKIKKNRHVRFVGRILK